MHMAPRLAILGILLVGAVIQPAPVAGLRPAADQPAGPSGRATVEPMPPLGIDLRLETIPSRVRNSGVAARLTIEIDAGPEVRDVTLKLVLPEGVQTSDDPLPVRPFALPGGARRQWGTMLYARQTGTHAVQVEATYRIGDGDIIQTRQATLLRAGGMAEGRHHVGAWEVMAVPIEDGPR